MTDTTVSALALPEQSGPEPEMTRNQLGALLRQVLAKQTDCAAQQEASAAQQTVILARLEEGNARFARIEAALADLETQVNFTKGHASTCLHGVQALLKKQATEMQVTAALVAVNRAVEEIEPPPPAPVGDEDLPETLRPSQIQEA